MKNFNESIFDLISRLHKSHHPAFTLLKHGLNDDEIARYFHKLPYLMPTEIINFYRYCDAVRSDIQVNSNLFPGGEILLPEMTIELYNMYVEYSSAIEEDLKEQFQKEVELSKDPYFILRTTLFWDRSWLPIFSDGSGGEYFVICSDVEQPTSPVYYSFIESGTIYLAFDSLTSLLQTIVDAFDTGAYYLHESGFIRENRAKLAPIINRHNPRRREYFLHTVQASSVQEIVQALDHPDPVMSFRAYSALRYMYEPEAIPLLIQQLQHPKSTVREKAVNLLYELNDNQAIEPLIPLLNDSTPEVQLATINALITFGDERAAKPLLAKLQEPNDQFRARIIYGLGELRAQPAVPALIAIAAKSALSLRQEAISALGKIADPAAVSVLITALRDENALVRSRAIKALEWIGDIRALEPLAVCATLPSSPPHDYLPQLAREAIAAIEARHQ